MTSPLSHSDYDEYCEPAPKKTRGVAKASYHPKTPNDYQIGGNHYKTDYEFWDFATDIQMRGLEFGAGKYLARFGTKEDEPALKDLQKVAHYIEKIISRVETKAHKPSHFEPLSNLQANLKINPTRDIARFITTLNGHSFKPKAVAALILLSTWSSLDDLWSAFTYVKELIAEEGPGEDPIKSIAEDIKILYKHHWQEINDPKTRKLLRDQLSELLSRNPHILEATIICDESNNPTDVIDLNDLKAMVSIQTTDGKLYQWSVDNTWLGPQ